MSQLINRKQGNPLTATQIKRRAEFARLMASLTPRKQGGINNHINTGPLNVRRATGLMASV